MTPEQRQAVADAILSGNFDGYASRTAFFMTSDQRCPVEVLMVAANHCDFTAGQSLGMRDLGLQSEESESNYAYFTEEGDHIRARIAAQRHAIGG